MDSLDDSPGNGKKRPKKRAIALGGGGPVAGFLIGALEVLEQRAIHFDVWSLSCIGAWVGLHYNQCSGGSRAAQTYEFFREHAFRDTDSYRGFPINRSFAPNVGAFASAWSRHLLDRTTWHDAMGGIAEWPAAAAGWARFMSTPMWMREGDLHAHLLNHLLAVHPMSRLMTSLVYQSGVNGLSNIHFESSSLLESLDLARLDLLAQTGLDRLSADQLQQIAAAFDPESIAPERAAQPEIYHNAWRLADDSQGQPLTGGLQLFNNKWARYRHQRSRDYLPISCASLCACSALPYVEQTVRLAGDPGREYSEGALVDTVNFANLVEDHPDLDEIWVCRIVDLSQLRAPKNLHDSLGNLCQQFAAEVGENDVRLFRNHLRKCAGRIPRVIEIPLASASRLSYRWDHANLDIGRQEGREAATALLERHRELLDPRTTADPWP